MVVWCMVWCYVWKQIQIGNRNRSSIIIDPWSLLINVDQFRSMSINFDQCRSIIDHNAPNCMSPVTDHPPFTKRWSEILRNHINGNPKNQSCSLIKSLSIIVEISFIIQVRYSSQFTSCLDGLKGYTKSIV